MTGNNGGTGILGFGLTEGGFQQKFEGIACLNDKNLSPMADEIDPIVGNGGRRLQFLSRVETFFPNHPTGVRIEAADEFTSFV